MIFFVNIILTMYMHYADSSYLSSEITEKGASLEHDSAPDTQNVNSDGMGSYVAPGETQQVNGRIDNPSFSHSTSYDNKSTYLSMVGATLWFLDFS